MSITDRNRLFLSVLPWANDIVTRRAGGRADADDVRQDAYLHLLKNARNYDPARAAPTTWAAVVLNSFLPRRLTRPVFAGPPPSPNAIPIEESHDPTAVDPAAEVERREIGERTRIALARVRPDDRVMIEAHALDGVTLADLDRTVSRERCSKRYAEAVTRCRREFARCGAEC